MIAGGQRGGFAMGLVAGLLIGLALALGVALYITKAPVPFVNKVPQRTPEQDSVEAERNRTWDPNAPLGGKGGGARAPAPPGGPASVAAGTVTPSVPLVPAVTPSTPSGPAASAPVTAAAPAASASRRDPAAILAGGNDLFVYFVQAGAFTRSEDAEQQRARLGLLGQSARVTEREQAGRTVYRVRMGPFNSRGDADSLQAKLQEQTIEAQIVRVEKP